MKKIPLITDENFADLFPDFKQWTHRITKIDLFNLDGTTSEVKLTFPIVTPWGCDQEISQAYLRAMINEWTKFTLKIFGYQVHLGSINDKGEEHYSISYEKQEIPLNKVYMPSKRIFGKWENPEVVRRRESKQNLNRMKKNMKQGRHPLDGSPIKSKPFTSLGYLN